jgi:hypothetical protein
MKRKPGQMKGKQDNYGGGGVNFGKLPGSHSGRHDPMSNKWCCGARLVLAVVFFFCLTFLLIYERMNTAGDPTYNSETDMKHYSTLYGTAVVCR